MTFKDGVIIDVKAEKGEKLLKDLIATDEGACRLGEVALVPDDYTNIKSTHNIL